jgi:hypothetical protein
MGIKAEEMNSGCFARAALDEPLFVLRAQDKSAPALVRQWAERFRADHVKAGTAGHELARAIDKYTDAMEVARSMEKWTTRKQAD